MTLSNPLVSPEAQKSFYIPARAHHDRGGDFIAAFAEVRQRP